MTHNYGGQEYVIISMVITTSVKVVVHIKSFADTGAQNSRGDSYTNKSFPIIHFIKHQGERKTIPQFVLRVYLTNRKNVAKNYWNIVFHFPFYQRTAELISVTYRAQAIA